MKNKIFYILASLFITLFQLFNWNKVQAQCNDAHGSIAFTGYQIADPVFTPQVNKDRFSFVVLDFIPTDSQFRFTDRGWTGSAFQEVSNAVTDGEFIWKTSADLPAGTHIVITLDGNFTSASVGTVSGYTGDFKIGIGGDQLFAYSFAPFKIHAAMLINKVAWDASIDTHGVPDFSSSSSLKPIIDTRQCITIAHLQGTPAVDQEDAFQAKLNPITLIGGRAALRTQLFAGTFTTQHTGTIDLTISPITWNVAPPTYTTLTLANKKITVNGITETCYYKWQKSTDGSSFTDISEGGAYTNTDKASLSINSALAQDTWFRVRLTDGKSIETTAIKLKALKINTQPVDQLACPGGTVSFSVAAEGEGTFRYKWEQRKTPTGAFAPISDGGIFSGTATSTLTLANPAYSSNNYAYRCVVTDDLYGNITGSSATLTVSNLAVEVGIADVGCFGAATGAINLTITGGMTPYTVVWNDGILTEDRTNLPAAPYDVTITDAQGCKVTETITIEQPTLALSIATPSIIHPSVYGGTNGSIQVTVSGGTTGYTYQWYKDGGAIATTKDISNIGAGVYKIIVTDANVCQQLVDNIIVLNPNAPPTITNLNGDEVTFLENSALVLIDFGSNATVTDTDSPYFAGGNVTVSIVTNRIDTEDVLAIRNEGTAAGQIGVSGSDVTYGGIPIGTLNPAGGTGTTNLVISLNTAATPAIVQALIRNLTYMNTNPSTAARTVAVTINDGDGGTSTAANVTVNVVAVNDAPTLTAIALNPTYTEGGPAVPMFSNAQSSTIEAGQRINELTLTLSGVQDGANELIVVDGTPLDLVNGNSAVTVSNGVSVVVSLVGTTVTVTLSKAAGFSTSDLNMIVNGIAYRNTSENPTTASRAVTIIAIRDNGGIANGGVDLSALAITSTINVRAVNDAAVVTTSGGNTTFTEGASSVAIDGALALSDPDNTTLASATVAITGNLRNTEDMLVFTNDEASMGNIASSYNVTAGVMTLTSTGSIATLMQWQAALRAVIYNNISGNPITDNRTISFTVNDGNAESTAAAKQLVVVAVNDAPTITAPVSINLTEDVPTAITGISFADLDARSAPVTVTLVASEGNLSPTSSRPGVVVRKVSDVITLTGAIYFINLFIAEDLLIYTPVPNSTADVTLTVSINDAGNRGEGGPKTATTSILLEIMPVNDPPVVTLPASITVTEDVESPLTGISFSDVDAGTAAVTVTLSVPIGTMTATSGNGVTVEGTGTSSLTLNGQLSHINAFIASGAVKFTTASNATNNVTLTVTINDNGNTGGTSLTDTKTIILLVTAVNDAPVNSVPSAQFVNQDATLVFSSANGNAISISDVDAGSGMVQVTLTATNGRITLSRMTGISLIVGTGANDVMMTFSGTITAINTALDGLVFTPITGYNGSAVMTIMTNDMGNTGDGGNLTDTDDITITVRPINPKVLAVGASITANGTYKVDDEITLFVAFDQIVTVTKTGGAPSLLLETGAVDRVATYVGGSGTNTLSFTYSVQAGDVSADLDYASTAALGLNGAVIKSVLGLDAILTLPLPGIAGSLGANADIVIDGVAPTVTSVTVPANGYYLLNKNMDFTVNFSEAVTVNTGGGIPTISLDIADQTKNASYLSGSGTTALTFRYIVETDLQDHNGITVGPLAVNGGTIRDAAGNNTVLTLNAVGNTNGVKVDSKNPALTLSINSGATHTNNRQVDLLFLTSDGDLYEMQFSNDNTTWSSWEAINWSKVWNLTTGDGTKTVYASVRDIAGNVTQVNAAIILDQTAPVVSGVVNNGLYKDDRTITFNEGNATLNNTPFTSGNTVTTDGTYTLVVTDAAGNVTTVQFEIDKTAPIVSGVENGKFYNTNRTITFNEGTAMLNGASFNSGDIVTAEGTYTLVVTDAATNATTVVFTIDKVAPVVLGVENGKTYNTDRTITFNKGDALLNGALFTAGTVVSAEGNYTLAVTDAAGNSTTIGFTIDKTAPAVPVNFVAVGQDKKIALAWTANAEPDFDKYLLYVKPEGATKTLLATIPKGTNNYLHAGLPNGVAYDFFLIAVDQVGNRSAEALASAKTMGEQTINFAALTDLTYGQQGVALTASATSNLPVSFTSSDPSIAQVYQDNNDAGKWKINAKKVGTVTITATQAGNNEYLTAATVGNSLTIVPADLTVTAEPKSKVYGEADPVLTYTVRSSDLRNGDAASVVTGTITRIVGENVGSYAINNVDLTASNYSIRYEIAQLTITKATLKDLSFANKEVLYDGTTKSLQLAGSLPTGVTVAYQNNDKINAGSYEVKAIIAETQNYFGTSFSATLLIRKAKQTISFTAPEVLDRDAGKVALDVYSSSSLPVSLIVDDPMVGTVSGTDLNVLRLGTVRITATQAGNANYEAASPVTVSVRIANDASAKLPIIVHQALSPNGDGINEFLIIEGIRDYIDNKVTIFDKNGVVLAEIQGYDNRERVFSGNAHRDGTYYYYIDVKDGNTWKREKGFFVIKR